MAIGAPWKLTHSRPVPSSTRWTTWTAWSFSIAYQAPTASSPVRCTGDRIDPSFPVRPVRRPPLLSPALGWAGFRRWRSGGPTDDELRLLDRRPHHRIANGEIPPSQE